MSMQPVDSAEIRSASQRYLWLAKRCRSDRPESANFQFYQGLSVYPPAGRYDFSGAIVLSGEWFVVAGQHVLSDGVVQTPIAPLSAYLVRFRSPNGIDLVFEIPEELKIGRAFLLGGCHNYAHWMLDFLPRLRLLPNCEVPLLVNASPAPFQTESLRHLRVDLNNLVPLEYPKSYRAKSLMVPSTRSSIVTPPLQFDPSIVSWLRQAFSAWFRSPKQDRRIFITRAMRSSNRVRRLLNHEEIEDIAVRHGFEIICSEKLPLAEQVALFSEAAVIAGPHGAGFTNIVFAPPNARVIEMMGPRFNEDQLGAHFRTLARLLGQQHTRIVADPNDAPIAMNHLPFETYLIPPERFIDALAS
jgi:hypothetical protein